MTTDVDHTPSRGCYQRGCQRPECSQANYQYMSRLRLEHHRGLRRRMDATQTRHHTERLIAAGWTQAQIARAAGLAHHLIGDIRRGQPTVANSTAHAILNIPVGPPPAPIRDVDATGTMRRLRALVAIGWPIDQLAPQLGIYPTALGNIARGELAHVRITTADTVALHYQHLIRRPGPSNRGRILARKKGWHGPAAWDGAAIDDPNAKPETGKPYKPADKYGRDPDRTREIEHLYLLNESPQQIAKQLGGNEKYIRDQLNVVIARRAKRAEKEKAAKAGLGAAA